MTARIRRRRTIVAALLLAGALGIAAAASGHSAPPAPVGPSEIGDAVSAGGAILLSS